jgi:hypothetical protein
MVIVVLQWSLLPRLHGRRQAAEWTARQTSALDHELPLVALGHSVQWLSFYVPRSMQRIDSLEAIISRRRSEWVLTTDAVYVELRKHRRVVAVHRGPAEPGPAPGKTPVLVRLAGTAEEAMLAQ